MTASTSQRTTPNHAFAQWLESHHPVAASGANPADRPVRILFGTPENAASYLRCMLPAEVKSELDLEELIPVPATLIDRKHRQDYTDVLFSVPMVNEQAFAHLVYGQKGTRHAAGVCKRARRSFVDSYAQFVKVHGQSGCTPEPPELITLGFVIDPDHDA